MFTQAATWLYMSAKITIPVWQQGVATMPRCLVIYIYSLFPLQQRLQYIYVNGNMHNDINVYKVKQVSIVI